MSAFSLRSRKALALLLSATVIAGGIAASGYADAKPFFKPGWGGHGGFGHHHVWGPGYGFGAVGLLGGLALAASAAAYEPSCYLTRRPVVDDFGNAYVERVRVCD